MGLVLENTPPLLPHGRQEACCFRMAARRRAALHGRQEARCFCMATGPTVSLVSVSSKTRHGVSPVIGLCV